MVIEREPQSPEHSSNHVRIFCDSREEAVRMVKEFWHAMPHAETLPPDDDIDGWCEELTAGDRTRVVSAGLRNPGKWIVSFSGNHQSLTREAEVWLKNNMQEKK